MIEEKTYYIYHIEGVKIGCTSQIEKRMADQGFSDWQILEEHTDIYEVSDREIELQKEYGLPVDKVPYWQAVQNRFKMNKEASKKVQATKIRNGTNKGWQWSEETRIKMKGRNVGRKHTEETLEKMRGRNVSEETRQKLSEAIKGKKASEETKLKLSQLRKGKKLNNNQLKSFNSKRSEIVTCPHCNKSGAKFNMNRYHFDKCKNMKQ